MLCRSNLCYQNQVLVEESYNNLDEEDHNTFSLIVIDIASEKVFNNYHYCNGFNKHIV